MDEFFEIAALAKAFPGCMKTEGDNFTLHVRSIPRIIGYAMGVDSPCNYENVALILRTTSGQLNLVNPSNGC